MNLVELKQSIRDNSLPGTIQLVFRCESDYFIADEYVAKIAEITHREIIYVDKLPTLMSVDDNLYVVKVSKLSNDVLTADTKVQYIICCKDTKLTLDSIIDFPRLREWQLVDYVRAKGLNLQESTIKELVSKCKSPYRLELELAKLSCFSHANQEQVCRYILDTTPDLFNVNIFDVTNGLVRKDLAKVTSFYNTDADVTGMYLLSVVLRNFKNIIDVQLNPRATPDSLGMSYKQFKAIQYSCGYYSESELIKIYKKLLSLDRAVKEGYIAESMLVDYIIVNIVGG